MSRTLVGLFAAVALVAALAQATPAEAQIFFSAPTVVYRPIVPTVVQPTTFVQPRTVCFGGAPVVAAPTPVVVGRAWTPVPVTRTRYRPILGGTVTRTRVYYAPTTVVAPAW